MQGRHPQEGNGTLERRILEICIEDESGLEAAVAGGADRIELCSALDLGGLTASAGLMRRCRGIPIPVVALIRPRPGGFYYTRGDAAVMAADITAAAETGLSGVAIGAITNGDRLDGQLLAEMIAHADAQFGSRRALRTLHRAADLVGDADLLVDDACALGFDRILTSGGSATVGGGQAGLVRMVARAAGRLSIMAGGGVRAATVASLVHSTGVREVHASARTYSAADPRLRVLGLASTRLARTDRDTVAKLRRALDRASARQLDYNL